MLKFRARALLFAGLLAGGLSAPASANVVYNLTFYDDFTFATVQGTGTLTLNFSTLAQTHNVNQSLSGILVSIAVPSLDGHGPFSITPANLNSGSFFGTGNVGQVFTFNATQAGSGVGLLFLDLFTNSWQLQNGNAFGGDIDDGAFKISGPTLAAGGDAAATPSPAALPLFASGAGLLSFLGWRKKRKNAAANAA
jgi:hypothetical protein